MQRMRSDLVAATGIVVPLGFGAELLRKHPHLPTSLHWAFGWLPSFSFALGSVSVSLLFGRSRGTSVARRRRIGISLLLGAVAYEFEQLWSLRRTFDWWDVIALIAGATLALWLDTAFDRKVDDHLHSRRAA